MNDLKAQFPPSDRRWFLFAFLTAFTFAVFTDHVWEDYFITYRASKNLATGKGLVFTEGQRVHSFTSPLGVLIPAACSAATFNSSDTAALWLFRLISCGFLGLTTVLLRRLAQKTGWSDRATLLLVLLFIFDAKTVDFSINGMETSLLVFFLALTLVALEAQTEDGWKLLGCAWAGLMWTRPDSFIYIGVLAAGYVMFSNRLKEFIRGRGLFQTYWKAALLTSALYLPWLLWAWSYYGSPVPHTVVAKGLGGTMGGLAAKMGAVLHYPMDILAGTSSMAGAYSPAYYNLGPWPAPVVILGSLLPAIPAVYWMFPGGGRLARTGSLCFFLFHLYLSRFMAFPFPWYYPGASMLGLLAVAELFQRAENFKGSTCPAVGEPLCRVLRGTAQASAIVVVVCGLVAFGSVAVQMRQQQQIIELGVRKKIGLWLRENSSSRTDTVFLEPLGYIGYYSQLKMYDWPGLSSPEVIEARRSKGLHNFVDIRLVEVLKPDWLVLRPSEYTQPLKNGQSELSTRYKPAMVFDATAEVDRLDYIPGRQYLLYDSRFVVFKRTTVKAGAAGPGPVN
ncbi:MAG TPA: hypothetical protein VK968_13950 [Roseimicrobium sp.]|nr:hypothetical protein [Roseimicrobium sp.]